MLSQYCECASFLLAAVDTRGETKNPFETISCSGSYHNRAMEHVYATINVGFCRFSWQRPSNQWKSCTWRAHVWWAGSNNLMDRVFSKPTHGRRDVWFRLENWQSVLSLIPTNPSENKGKSGRQKVRLSIITQLLVLVFHDQPSLSDYSAA